MSSTSKPTNRIYASILVMLSVYVISSRVRNLSMVKAWIYGDTYSSKRFCQTTRMNQGQGNQQAALQSRTPVVPRKFVPFPFPYHHIIEARVESLTNLGFGICRVPLPNDTIIPKITPSCDDVYSSYEEKNDDNNELTNQKMSSSSNKGWVVMVPNVIPGERISCRIYRNHNTYSDADLITIIDNHPQRITPKCKLAVECGGCQYQHMDISLQREWKTTQVQELYERVGKFDKDKIPKTLPALGTEHVYNYRSKITPHYDAPDRNKSKELETLGFQKKNSRQILDVTHCDIATQAINDKLKEVRKELFAASKGKSLKKPNKGATLLLRDAWAFAETEDDESSYPMPKNQPVVETNPNVYVKAQVKELVFRFLAGNFFQNNPFILPLMVDRVIEASIALNTHGQPMTHLIDCYCGSGLFCLSAAAKFHTCVGIEVNDRAIEEARINARLNHIGNCKFIAASAEAIFESTEPILLETSQDMTSRLYTYVKDFPRDTTVVILDPPRKGCSPAFLEQMFDFRPQRIVYMSCDPATQARDAKSIAANGYNIISIEPIDLFPQTRHIECLTVFEKKAEP